MTPALCRYSVPLLLRPRIWLSRRAQPTPGPVTALLDVIVVGIHSAGRAQSGSCDTTRLW
jgi:hypothetical protein